MAQRVPVDPDKGVDELVKQIANDSKRLFTDEIRLAKLEARENASRAGRGAMWLGVAFGVGVVALVAFTLFLATVIGQMADDNYWIGAAVTAAVEIAAGWWLLRRGLALLKTAPVTLPDTRAGLRILKG